MRAQTEAAIDAADVCLFLIDARAGVTPLDRHFASLLIGAGQSRWSFSPTRRRVQRLRRVSMKLWAGLGESDRSFGRARAGAR